MKQPYGQTLENIKSRISTWTGVHTMLDTTDAEAPATPTTEAADKIFQWAAPSMATSLPPRITIDAHALSRERRGVISLNGILSAELLFEIPIPTADAGTEASQKEWFMEYVVDAFLDGLEDEPGVDGGLNLAGHSMTLPPGLVDPDELPNAARNLVLWVWQEQIDINV